MNKLKRVERVQSNMNMKNTGEVLVKSDKIVIVRKIQLMHQKIQRVFSSKKLRSLGLAFMEIFMYKMRNSAADKSSSIVSPFRNYSKVDNSERGDS